MSGLAGVDFRRECSARKAGPVRSSLWDIFSSLQRKSAISGDVSWSDKVGDPAACALLLVKVAI